MNRKCKQCRRVFRAHTRQQACCSRDCAEAYLRTSRAAAKAAAGNVEWKAIATAHAALIPTLPNVWPGDELRSCWACGHLWPVDETPALYKAHIVGRANGGGNEPSNKILLCDVCHRDQPDGLDVDMQIAWLRARPSYLTMLADAYRPIADALQAHAASVGGEALLTEFVRLPREKALAMVEAAGGKPCGFKNGAPNDRWAVLAAFKNYIVEATQQ